MKKSLSIILFTFLATLIFSQNYTGINITKSGLSGTSKDKKISWSLTNEGQLRIEGKGELENLCNGSYELPFSFKNNSIKTVIIGSGITSIPARAFQDCEILRAVILPDSMEKIGEMAFLRCKSLEKISIPDKVETISRSTFSECINLKSVKLPSKLETIENNAFGSCEKLETIFLPENIKTIESSAFKNCKNLEVQEIPGSVQVIEKEAFACCKLTHLKIGYGVRIIEDSAFWSCDTETVEIPDTMEKIYAYAFEDCNNLKTVELPDSTIYNKYSFPAGQNGSITTKITFRKSTLPDQHKTVTYSEKEIKNPVIKINSNSIDINCNIPVCKLIITNKTESEIIIETIFNDEDSSPEKQLIVLKNKKNPQTIRLYSKSKSLTLNILSEESNSSVEKLAKTIECVGEEGSCGNTYTD